MTKKWNEPTRISWTCAEERMVMDWPYMQVIERLCKKTAEPQSEGHRFYIFRARDWCNIIPVTTEGKILMVRQFRAGSDGVTLEFPGGVVESTDADVAATAIREMVEETGYEPLPGARCTHLGSSYPNPALQDNRVHALVVGPVRPAKAQNLDPAEDIEIVEVGIDELPGLVRDGKFTHALMLTTLLHFLSSTSPAAMREMTASLASFAKTSH